MATLSSRLQRWSFRKMPELPCGARLLRTEVVHASCATILQQHTGPDVAGRLLVHHRKPTPLHAGARVAAAAEQAGGGGRRRRLSSARQGRRWRPRRPAAAAGRPGCAFLLSSLSLASASDLRPHTLRDVLARSLLAVDTCRQCFCTPAAPVLRSNSPAVPLRPNLVRVDLLVFQLHRHQHTMQSML